MQQKHWSGLCARPLVTLFFCVCMEGCVYAVYIPPKFPLREYQYYNGHCCTKFSAYTVHDSQYRIGGIYSTSDHNSHSLNQESKNIGSLSLIDKQNFTLFPSVPLLQPTVQLSVFKLRLSRYFDSNALEILLCNHQTRRETKYKHFYLCFLLAHFTNKIYWVSHLMVGLPMSIY